MKPLTTRRTRIVPSRIRRDAGGVPLPADGPVTQPTDAPGETRRLITKITSHCSLLPSVSQIVCLTFDVRHGETRYSLNEKDKQEEQNRFVAGSGFFPDFLLGRTRQT